MGAPYLQPGNNATFSGGAAVTGIALNFWMVGFYEGRNVVSSGLTAGAWTSTGFAEVPVSYTPTSSGLVYFTFLKNGAFATTDVGLLRNVGASSVPSADVKLGTSPAFAVYQSGQATMPATATLAPYDGANLWIGWN